MSDSGYVTAVAHAMLVGHGPPYDLTALVGTPRAVAAMGVAAAAGAVVNVVLVAGVIRRVAPATPMRQLVADRDRLVTDAAELGMGVVTTVCWIAAPALVVALLPPVLLLQRSLLHAELQEAARTDAKTRLANPEYWRQVATREVARAVRGGGSLAVLLIDIDHFKRFNDTYGHLAGDQALAGVAAALTESVRPGDLVGRFGGEEFAVLLRGASQPAAARTAERIRGRIEGLSLPVVRGSAPLRVTVSVGVAGLGPSRADLNELLESADTALYEAKAGGRNNVRLADLARDLAEISPRGSEISARSRARVWQ
ncbi:MAG: diguanylate cyclase [Streptosporangiales bacterium]|nr:diguanylate cyclase [Streptosporangiales bacterium]